MGHKISKFQWFNEIPSHWKESKISYLFEIGRGRVISGPELKEDGLYPVYSSQTKNDGCMGMIDTYDFDDDLITWTTDGANAGTIFIRSGKFNCTNVCGTLKPVVDADLKYYYYYLQFVTQFYKRPDTNGAKIMNNEMASVHALIPPLSEQTKIAAFLDQKTAQIDTIIAKKQKLLQLLEEKKKSVINEAVTKGLNPNVPMKDSGIEWIGDIPESWELIRLRFLANFTTGNRDTIHREDDGQYPFFVRSPKIERINSYAFDGEAILMAGDGVGAGKVFHYYNGKFDYHQRVYNIHNFKDLFPKFLYYYMSLLFVNIMDQMSAKNTVDSVRLPMIENFPVPVFEIEEQKLIVDFIEKKIDKLDKLENKISKQLGSLQEYKQSLISEAVTGKFKI